MLRACVRTVSTPIESWCAICALLAPSWSSSSTSTSRGVSRSDPSMLKVSPPPAAAERGSTCMPREARWMALMMSRASVSLDRQAVAPKDSIWLHSAALGRLASTTMRVSGWAWWSWKTSAGARRVPKLSNTTAGAWRAMARSTSPTGMSVSTSSRLGSSEIRTLSPTATRSSNLADMTEGMPVSLRGEGGERVRKPHPRSTRFPPPRILPISLASSPRFHTAGVATKAARAGTIQAHRLNREAQAGRRTRKS